VSEIVVVNRSSERGRALAQKVGGRYEEWSRLEPELRRVDVVISGTGAQLPVIGPDLMKSVMKARRHEPIFLVDIAVPRDVDPRVARMEHVFVYNVDDLQGIVHDNLRARAAEADRATAIVDAELEAFARWQRTRAVGPLIGRLQGRGEEIAAIEARKALGRLPGLAPEQRQIVEQLARAVARKLVHAPVTQLRAASAGDDPADAAIVEAFERIFALEGPAEVESSDTAEAAEEPVG
jgi:glutamyl-tRNA reductase